MSDLNKDSDRASGMVSAIVVSYHTGPLLARCLEALASQPQILEIILVDNGNPPEEIERAKTAIGDEHPLILLSGHGNVGFAKACNLGAKEATGTFLLFINPDAVLPDGGLKQLLEDGEGLKRPWVIGPRVIDPDGAEQQGARREGLTPWRAMVEASRLYKLAPHHPYFRRFNLHEEICPDDIVSVPTISGSCFFLHKEDYFLIDGMDERYFLHVEDVDFCYRFTQAGGGVYFDPNLNVMHMKSSSRVSPLRVEARKIASMGIYFRRHFTQVYPPGFLWIVTFVLWGVFALKATKRILLFGIALARLGARRGVNGLRRALSLTSRRQSR